jgi:hypothetical protein
MAYGRRSIKGNYHKPVPSIGDRERMPTEFQTIKPAQRARDKYDDIYESRVAAGRIDHKSNKWRGGKKRSHA